MLDRFGPYFAFDVVATPDAAWTRVADAAEPGVLAAAVERTRVTIAEKGPVSRSAADLRAVASTMALGTCARLVSPAIGGSLAGEPAPAPDPTTLWLGDTASGPARLATSAAPVAGDPDATLDHVLLPFLDAVRAQFGVPEGVLLGNAAAAVVGACQVVGIVEPDLQADAEALRARMLTTDPLVGTGTPTGEFVRTSCCQIHRLPMGYLCPNCLLVQRRTGVARRFAEGRPPRPLARTVDFTRPPFRRTPEGTGSDTPARDAADRDTPRQMVATDPESTR